MKQIILKTPTFIFIFLFCFRLWMYFFLDSAEWRELSRSWYSNLIQFGTWYIWTLSLTDYFCFKSKNSEFKNPVYLIASLLFVLALFSTLTLDPDFNYAIRIVFWALYAVLCVLQSVYLIKIIKPVFYARSTWFVFLETLIPFWGILTLTPEIKRWEQEDAVNEA